MDKAREIVLMLILRKREARQRLRLAQRTQGPVSNERMFELYGETNEAQNACELARRILYGKPR